MKKDNIDVENSASQKVNKPEKVKKQHTWGAKFLSNLIFKILFVLILIAACYFGFKYFVGNPFEVTLESKHTMVEKQLEQCAELTLSKMRYSDVVSIKKTGVLGMAKSYSLVRYTGIIRAGIEDISKAKIEFSNNEQEVTVTLPLTTVLANDIVHQEVFDEQQNVFVAITTQEVFDAIEAAQNETITEILADGFLDEADNRAKLVVTQMLQTLGFSKVVVLKGK
jgi:hypothetical protein